MNLVLQENTTHSGCTDSKLFYAKDVYKLDWIIAAAKVFCINTHIIPDKAM